MAGFVPYLLDDPEQSLAMGEKRSSDRRVQKTINLLHQALGHLIREKPYDEILVQEILDRANVGRSTFYMHFRDKDELLVSGIHDMLGSVHATVDAGHSGPHERIVRFSLPVFEHIHPHLRTGAAKMGPRGRAIVHEHLKKIVAKQIAGEVKGHFRGRQREAGQIPPDLLVQYLASTFILVLNWWVECRNPLPPKEVDLLFRGLIQPTLAAAFSS